MEQTLPSERYFVQLILIYIYMQLYMYLLTLVGLTPGGSRTVHIYTQTIHRKTQLIWLECGQCPVFASFTLQFTLQLRKNTEKLSLLTLLLLLLLLLLLNYLENISYEKELNIDNKLHNNLKITGILNNVFRPQNNP